MNALEELAERLGKIKTPPTFYLTADAYHRANDDLAKAKQIIAELAKVGDTTLPTFDGRGFVMLPNCTTSIMAVSKCRAIAEEGAEQ